MTETIPETAEVVIIGAGTAGLSALREVRRVTEDVLLINDGHWGTTCAATGCMPSKALIEAANAFHRRTAFEAFGIRGAEALSVDAPAVLARVRRLRDGFVKGPESVRERLGARAIAARARLKGPGCVDVAGREVRAGAVIVATGSRPVLPEAWRGFGDRVITTDAFFELPDLPRRVAVVGMGAIGVELAQAMARLGVSVAGFDAAERPAGLTDPDVAAFLTDALSAEFDLALGVEVALREAAGGVAVVAGDRRFEADMVLAAVGRRPNVDDIGLDTLGVPLDDRGLPEIDPTTLQVGDLPVWIAGDANGVLPLLHEAADEGHIAGRNAVARTPDAYRRRAPLAITFSAPCAAAVGRPFSALDPESTVIGGVDFARQGRARTAERAAGALRVYAARDGGRLLGAEMACPAAEHMAHSLALALSQGLTLRQILAAPFYHPVLEEGLRTALRDAARRVEGPKASDLSACPEIGCDALD